MARSAQNFLLTTFDHSVESFTDLIHPIVSKAAYQLERCPSTGRQHIQAYIKTKEPTSFKKLKILLGNSSHIETTRSPSAALKYCTKDESRIEGPYLIGISRPADVSLTIRGLIENGDLQTLWENHFAFYIRHRRAILEEIALRTIPFQWNHTRGIWLYGPSGCGKSSFTLQLPDIYVKPLNKWWDGYRNNRFVTGDDWDSTVWGWGTHYVKCWTDHYPLRGEIKGSTVPLNYEWFIITSNETLQDSLSKLPHAHQIPIIRRFRQFEYSPDTINGLKSLFNIS